MLLSIIPVLHCFLSEDLIYSHDNGNVHCQKSLCYVSALCNICDISTLDICSDSICMYLHYYEVLLNIV